VFIAAATGTVDAEKAEDVVMRKVETARTAHALPPPVEIARPQCLPAVF